VNDDEDLNPNEEEEFEGHYVVDENTHDLLSTVFGCLHMLANTQVNEEARENLVIIAHELAERFMLGDLDEIAVEEQIHSTDEGEEIIYKPRGGVFGDDEPEQEGEAPAVDSE
jgi:hypothetical protein